jgi:hypothetical protein
MKNVTNVCKFSVTGWYVQFLVHFSNRSTFLSIGKLEEHIMTDYFYDGLFCWLFNDEAIYMTEYLINMNSYVMYQHNTHQF